MIDNVSMRLGSSFATSFWQMYSVLSKTDVKNDGRSLPASSAILLHCLLFCLFLADQIFYRSWPWFSCGTVCVCPQLPYRGNDMIIWIFQLSLVTRFACDIGQLARIWIWVSSEVITISVLNTSQLATPCWRDPTRSKQLSTVAIVGPLKCT